MSATVSDIIETNLLTHVAYTFTVTTPLYGLLWLSDGFDAFVPLWMLWVVTAGPSAAGALACARCSRFQYMRHPTKTGSTR